MRAIRHALRRPYTRRPPQFYVQTAWKRDYHVEGSPFTASVLTSSQLLNLPKSCPGCGAYTSLANTLDPGSYSLTRKSVHAYLRLYEHGLQAAELSDQNSSRATKCSESSAQSLLRHSDPQLHEIQAISTNNEGSVPICDRCHQILHHSRGTAVNHPSIESVQEIILRSPYKHNHVYHILDAADFPMSLIPDLQRRLSVTPQRSKNRRAKSGSLRHGSSLDLSFVITRSDLLAPRKEQVDSLMPYMVQVLRDALGNVAEHGRLGNVHCVSAKRGWWTASVKDEVWKRGGGGWMLGKVNVGKSNLLETIFPKGRCQISEVGHSPKGTEFRSNVRPGGPEATCRNDPQIIPLKMQPSMEDNLDIGGDELLPPLPTEASYPVFPIVSSLPGTTAAPIRLPFGNGRGELIDLPGLGRDDLGQYAIPGHEQDVIMSCRPKPAQFSIKPGDSLLIGGLVRITPLSPEINYLAYTFVPLHCQVASTTRTISLQESKMIAHGNNMGGAGDGTCIRSAGIFDLKWDVTKDQAGPLTEKHAVGLETNALPFIVFSTDILIEGSGWVELVAQVRRKHYEEIIASGNPSKSNHFPQVEVVTPNGRHVNARRPMNAWLLANQRPGGLVQRLRPRRSMKGAKNRSKHD